MARSRHRPLKDLNRQQREAAEALVRGKVLVVAGAGTGKTTTIVHTIADLVANHNVSPSSVLLLTFTNKAAAEMLERANKLIRRGGAWGRRSREHVEGGTFHSFALKQIRRHYKALGFSKQVQVLDQGDGDVITRAIHKDLTEAAYRTSNKVMPPPVGEMAKVLDYSIGTRTPLRVLCGDDGQFKEFKPDRGTLIRFRRLYDEAKQQANKIDFGDMLSLMVQLLKDRDFRHRLRDQYKWVFVDEYQDTNAVQERIVRGLVGVDTHLMVVGDDAQAIYGFRGAKHDNIFKVHDYWPDTELVKLTRNYRSTQRILDLANFVQHQMAKQIHKQLTTRRSGGRLPSIVQHVNATAQAEWVVSQMRNYHRTGTSYREMSVLYRLNASAFPIELQLNKAKIPYRKYGGLKVTETKHVKDVLSFLRCAIDWQDDLAAKRVLTLAPGVGNATSDRIIAADARRLDLRIGKAGGGKLEPFRVMMRRCFKTRRKPPVVAVKDVVDFYISSKLLPPKERAAKTLQREDELRALVTIAKGYDTLQTFVDDLSLDPQKLDRERETDRPIVAVTLSTGHSAKGLEWNDVWVIDAVDGIMPWRPANTRVMTNDIQEELRLLYVALTRARNRLCVTWPMDRGPVSPWLEDAGDDLVKWKSVVSQINLPGY